MPYIIVLPGVGHLEMTSDEFDCSQMFCAYEDFLEDGKLELPGIYNEEYHQYVPKIHDMIHGEGINMLCTIPFHLYGPVSKAIEFLARTMPRGLHEILVNSEGKQLEDIRMVDKMRREDYMRCVERWEKLRDNFRQRIQSYLNGIRPASWVPPPAVWGLLTEHSLAAENGKPKQHPSVTHTEDGLCPIPRNMVMYDDIRQDKNLVDLITTFKLGFMKDNYGIDSNDPKFIWTKQHLNMIRKTCTLKLVDIFKKMRINAQDRLKIVHAFQVEFDFEDSDDIAEELKAKEQRDHDKDDLAKAKREAIAEGETGKEYDYNLDDELNLPQHKSKYKIPNRLTKERIEEFMQRHAAWDAGRLKTGHMFWFKHKFFQFENDICSFDTKTFMEERQSMRADAKQIFYPYVMEEYSVLAEGEVVDMKTMTSTYPNQN